MRTRLVHVAAAVLLVTGALLAPTRSLGAGASPGTIQTVAGTGVDGHDGDGGPATSAAIDHPRGIAVLPDGGFVFVEPFANTVRRVGPDGAIATVAGDGSAGFSGDDGPASAAALNGVHGVGLLPDGSLVLADPGNHRIRRVWPNGTITTVAGNGIRGSSGDASLATAAELDNPRGLAALPDSGFLIADTDNQRVRRVWPDGTITTVAGNGFSGFVGDGGPAISAELDRPFGVSPTRDGGFLIADASNQRVRRVSPGGVITTVAGTGTAGFSGDGGPATAAELDNPHNIVALPDGGVLIADTFNNRVRRVWPDGTITTVAGTGVSGFSGDGGPAAAAELNQPKALAVLPDDSGFLVGDAVNNRIRLVRVNLRPALELYLAAGRLTSKMSRRVTLRYTLSEPAIVRLFVSHRGTIVVRRLERDRMGANHLGFGQGLKPGTYAVRVVAATPDGRAARANASLRIVP
jgi:hypothetical protein